MRSFSTRAGHEWARAFQVTPASHPDYPLLLPASIARHWQLLEVETLIVPIVLSVLFAALSALLLYTGLWALRGPGLALLAGLVLLGDALFQRTGRGPIRRHPLGVFLPRDHDIPDLGCPTSQRALTRPPFGRFQCRVGRLDEE